MTNLLQAILNLFRSVSLASFFVEGLLVLLHFLEVVCEFNGLKVVFLRGYDYDWNFARIG